MMPRTLDEESVQAKLELMATLLRRLDRFDAVDRDSVESDLDQRLILERIVTQLVDLAVGINTQIVSAELRAVPADYAASFPALAEVGAITPDLARRLAPSTGMRNVLINAYLDLDVDRFVSSVRAGGRLAVGTQTRRAVPVVRRAGPARPRRRDQ